jgi:hypothetical protein
MKKVVIILALVLTSTMTFAQDAPPDAAPVADAPASKFAAAVDIVYPYLWRGIALNSLGKVAVQPYISYAATDKLTLGVWGSTNFTSEATPNNYSYNEFDWYVSYQVTPIVKVMVSDYYYDSPAYRGSYFNYDETSTQAIDASVLLNFSDKGIPLDFQWNTLVAGNDFKYNTNGDKSRNFSSYSEIGYTFSCKKTGINYRLFAGAVVNSVTSAYYLMDGFKFSNVGLNASKVVKISEIFSLPVFVRYTYNDNGNLNKAGEIKRNFISAGTTFNL